jgi:hypothetical protein
MFVSRRTFVLKKGRGHTKKALDLLLAEMERVEGILGVPRVLYSYVGGLAHRIVVEYEFESLDAYEKAMSEYRPAPEFVDMWNELTISGDTLEIWRLIK